MWNFGDLAEFGILIINGKFSVMENPHQFLNPKILENGINIINFVEGFVGNFNSLLRIKEESKYQTEKVSCLRDGLVYQIK